MDKNSKQDQEKMKDTFGEWAEQALNNESYPVIAISMKENLEIMLHRATEYPTWKLKILLHQLADAL